MRVSILIPVYNEFRTLPRVLERVRAAPLPPQWEREIVVVDDGSTDGSMAALRSAQADDLIVVHHRGGNFGKGTAIRTGLGVARGDAILVQDGDLEYDPADYAALLAPIAAGRAVAVYGTRFHGGRAPAGMAWPNQVANRILTFAANALYGAGISDEATAYKAFRADVLRSLRLRCRRFEFCPEVTARLRRLGFDIAEVPIAYQARGIAEGKKIRARDGWAALWTLIKYRCLPRRRLGAAGVASQSTPAAESPE